MSLLAEVPDPSPSPSTTIDPGNLTSLDTWTWIGTQLLGFGGVLLRILGIIVGIAIAAWLLRVIIRRVVDRIVNGAKSKARVDDTQALDRSPLSAVRLVQRTRTLGTILQNIVNVILVIVALVWIASIAAPNALASLTLLTAAVGAGLGFGAQNIVKDVLNGIFIVAEDQIGIGDVVDLGLATGIVEFVSVRITHVRDVNGTLWYVRNGEITRIGNMSQGWSRVIIDLAVPTDAEIDDVETAMLSAAKAMAKEPKWRSRIIEQPEIWGLESISGDALVIRIVMKTRSSAKDDVARELRARLKRAIDAMGIALPQLNSIMLTGPEGAQSVRGAHPPKTKETQVAPGAERPRWRPRGRKIEVSETVEDRTSDAPPRVKKKKAVRDDTPTAIVNLPDAPGADQPKPTPPAVRADEKDTP
ncbi:small-conductance mechanosensitive channel [Microbacterium testaceum StLB037]|uniref:Small-conductance mechanosensitive channel n=1 Tax=Microbacterium testaceum (strain StLB037) TaxID=979556 RepID=E8NDL5_MICTS|nr:mechanosensitive ion channel family protein [Microbacterium testaceum]BAJ76281.1 small-conductance mechanosensitive channel [Microbacterium testaceum StLB037]